jgi:hypothetical protein
MPATDAAPPLPRAAWLGTQSYAGLLWQRVVVIGETQKSWRIRAMAPTKLAGRNRWLNHGKTAYVPKHSIRFRDPALADKE